MEYIQVRTPFCGAGNLRSVAIAGGFIYLVGPVYIILDNAELSASIVTRSLAFVGLCVLQ
jgi:hypothetical protein